MQNDVRKDFALRLSELMRQQKMSQVQVAAWLGVSQSAVSDWTRGASAPPVDIASLLADRFGVSLDFLTGRKSDDEQTSAWTPEERSAAELAVLVVRHGVEETKRLIRRVDTPPESSQPRPIMRAPATDEQAPVRRFNKPERPLRPIKRAPATDEQAPVRRIGRREEEK